MLGSDRGSDADARADTLSVRCRTDRHIVEQPKRLDVHNLMRRPFKLGRIAHVVGTTLFVAGSIYVVKQAFLLHNELGALLGDPATLHLLALLIISYALALVVLAAAWGLLAGARLRPIGAAIGLLHLYALANLGKYLPGNVFHYGLRQLFVRWIGVSQANAALATLSEQLLQLSVAGAIAGFVTAASGSAVRPVLGQPWTTILGLAPFFAAALLLLLPSIVPRFVGALPAGHAARMPDRHRMIVAAMLQTGFFVVLGLLVAIACRHLVGDVSPVNLLGIAGIYLWCWLAGFVVPGAPGGLGVREALVVIALGPHIGNEGAVMLGLFTRLITVLGDVVFAAFGAAGGALKMSKQKQDGS